MRSHDDYRPLIALSRSSVMTVLLFLACPFELVSGVVPFAGVARRGTISFARAARRSAEEPP
jgi:hypothetical protein